MLETIVALVILSAAMIVFFEFLSTTLDGARRLELASIAYDRRTNALEIAAAINPMALPQGTLDFGPYHITWSAQRLGDTRQSSAYPIGAGPFKVALYRMVFSFPDSHDIRPIAVTRLGFRRDTGPQSPFASDAAAAPNGGTP